MLVIGHIIELKLILLSIQKIRGRVHIINTQNLDLEEVLKRKSNNIIGNEENRGTTMHKVNLEKNRNQLIELYSKALNESEESFGLGYLIQIEANFSIFESVNEYGVLDSIQLRYNDYIDKVSAETNYISLYQDFIQYNKTAAYYDLYRLLDQYEAKNKVLDFFTVEDQIYSFVLKSNESIVKGYVEAISHARKELTVKIIGPSSFEIGERISIPLQDIILVDLFSNENFLLKRSLDQR